MNRPSSVKIAVTLILASTTAMGLVSLFLNIAAAPEHLFATGHGCWRHCLTVNECRARVSPPLGKNWARIVFAIFGMYAIVTGVNGPNPLGVHHPFVVTNHWIGMAATAAILVALLVPSFEPLVQATIWRRFE